LFGDESGNVLLLGDAAHAIVPTLGQGATFAIEDSCVAAEAIIRAMKDGTLGKAAVEEIQNKRLQRCMEVSDVSIEASQHLMTQSRPREEIV
jgi:salicylate hydroxylase